jgi:hypothetical protein
MRAHKELVVGGAGPWPATMPHGSIVRDFGELRGWMANLDSRRREGAQGVALEGSSRSRVAQHPRSSK